MMTIITLQQYYNEILILQQHTIYNVLIQTSKLLNGHFKIRAIFHKPFHQLYKYSCNIAIFQRNIL